MVEISKSKSFRGSKSKTIKIEKSASDSLLLPSRMKFLSLFFSSRWEEQANNNGLAARMSGFTTKGITSHHLSLK